MRAIIDLGTNTFHLLIAEVVGNVITEHKKLQVPVKIGEGGINRKQIAPAAFERGMEALKVFREWLDVFGISEVKAFGTSAIRDAENGSEFIATAKTLYNINIETISGDTEAELIYKGVKQALDLPDANALIMDIGGGSVEFIICRKDQILWKYSFQLGAARLIEVFHRHDPIAADEIIALQTYLTTELKPLCDAMKQFPTEILIGSAGSFETLTEVLVKDLLIGIIPLSEHADEVSMHSFSQFHETVITKDSEERSKLHGMADFRVEMIVAATILMDVVIKQFAMKRLIVSHYALKEGILFSH
jgi:exopolyphosphatase/guanosine-5'-triphosphate,3'-diphosphate pyrophosphatase